MIRRLRHPWWLHAPALAIYAGMLVALARALPLSSRVPMQFGWDGRPTRWGAPWEVYLVAVVVPLLLIGLGFAAGESWARQPRGGRFNPMALFDAVCVGFLAGIFAPWIGVLEQGERAQFMPPWPWLTLFGLPLAAAAVTIALEMLRPWQPPECRVSVEQTDDLTTEIASHQLAGARWAYWEAQNPAYVTVLVVGVSALLLVGAWQVWEHLTPWLAPELVIAAGFLALCYGGLRTSVTAQAVQVRLGMLGIRLMQVPTGEVEEVTVHAFSPLADFGGWGIRMNREMRAFFFRGERGVKLRTKDGRQFLIGSDHPERLAAAIRAASRPA